MHKQSPSKGVRKSKGFKVKHVLQICVLLAVCFWLIYQVKHSQAKRQEFDAKGEKVVDKMQTDGEIIKFGRKDLPRVTEIAKGDDKHGEHDNEKEDEDVEENKPEEEIKHEKDEDIEEREEERRGGDDETDDSEFEKKEAEYEHGEEDKESVENEGDVEENRGENEEEFSGKEEHIEDIDNENARKEDHNDHNGGNADTHEAREEQYKADDASSEVTHQVQSIIPKTENVTMGHANDMFGNVDVGHENDTKSADNPDALIKTKDEPRENKDEISKGRFLEQNQFDTNMTKVKEEQPALSKGLQTTFNGNVSRNVTVEAAPAEKDANLLDKVLGDNNKPKIVIDENTQSQTLGDPNKTEDAYINTGESLGSRNATTASQMANDTGATKAAEDSSASNENHDENLVSNAEGESDDPIDESDTNAIAEEKESRVDLETLPEEAMAE